MNTPEPQPSEAAQATHPTLRRILFKLTAEIGKETNLLKRWQMLTPEFLQDQIAKAVAVEPPDQVRELLVILVRQRVAQALVKVMGEIMGDIPSFTGGDDPDKHEPPLN